MRILLVSILSMGLLACAPVPPADEAGPNSALEGSCDGQAGQGFLRQTVSADLGQRVLSATGARQLRWVPPRSAVTMDFRPDRLSVEYDDDRIVTRVSCG